MDPSQPVTVGTLAALASAPSGSLADSYVWCQRLARARAGNFYYSFMILPKAQRLAMCALYAFMRVADDLADGEGPVDARRQALEAWRKELQSALDGSPHQPIYHALRDTIKQFHIQPEHLHTLLDGVSRDLSPLRFATFAELKHYCYQVASVVGLCCVRIWGGQDERITPLAESAGLAFQLTNILRDVRSDASQGRVYLPDDLLAESGCSAETILRQEWNSAIKAVLYQVADKAREHYAQAKPLNDYLPSAGRAVWGVMSETYQRLLDQLIKQQFDPLRVPPRTSRWRKMSLLLRALPVRFGWKEAV